MQEFKFPTKSDIVLLFQKPFVQVTGGGLFLAGIVAWLPQEIWPKCPVYTFTGLFCPGCGGLRAAHALLEGDFVGAIDQNAAIFVIPLLVFAGLWIQKNANQKTNLVFLIVTIIASALFTIARNVPGSWLAPN